MYYDAFCGIEEVKWSTLMVGAFARNEIFDSIKQYSFILEPKYELTDVAHIPVSYIILDNCCT